jgi:hypothetical protein
LKIQFQRCLCIRIKFRLPRNDLIRRRIHALRGGWVVLDVSRERRIFSLKTQTAKAWDPSKRREPLAPRHSVTSQRACSLKF